METSIIEDVLEIKRLSAAIMEGATEEEQRVTVVKMKSRRPGWSRSTIPYPQCTGCCPVTSAWGEKECRVICPEKFPKEAR